MNNTPNLLFFTENRISFQNQVRSLIVECGIPFKELDSISQIFSLLKTSNYYAIILLKNQDSYSTIINLAKSYSVGSRLFISCPEEFKDAVFFNNFCTDTQLDTLKQFLINNVRNENISVHPQPPTLIQKLVRAELEDLGISKKYIGFKYTVDLLINALCNKIYNAYDIELFEYVASINLTTPDSVERDIRHMLLNTWHTCSTFKNTLSTIHYWDDEINAKNILNSLILYLKQSL